VIVVTLRRCAAAATLLLICATADAGPTIAPGPAVTEGHADPPPAALVAEDRLVRDIIAGSFPRLIDVDIRLTQFRSQSDYFRTSFSLGRFLAGRRMRYYVRVNPAWRAGGAPVEGVRSILAHELAHVEELSHGKRIRLFRMTGLLFKGWTARFERRADLTALARDYGAGLKTYRAWLYDHVPADALDEKRRDYFSPDEIDAIVAATASRPDLFEVWRRHVPMNLTDIQTAR
jgi:hypothetical protein